jgi:hypothetical protein
VVARKSCGKTGSACAGLPPRRPFLWAERHAAHAFSLPDLASHFLTSPAGMRVTCGRQTRSHETGYEVAGGRNRGLVAGHCLLRAFHRSSNACPNRCFARRSFSLSTGFRPHRRGNHEPGQNRNSPKPSQQDPDNRQHHSQRCGSTLAASGKCQISVTFTPTQLGVRAGKLTVVDSANNSPQGIPRARLVVLIAIAESGKKSREPLASELAFS